MRRSKNAKVAEALIDKMFEIAGHDVRYKDVTGRTDNWYQQWTMTAKQQEEWMKWGATYLANQLRIPKFMAEREMDMFNFNYGLSLNTKISEKSNKTV